VLDTWPTETSTGGKPHKQHEDSARLKGEEAKSGAEQAGTGLRIQDERRRIAWWATKNTTAPTTATMRL
jgi:hypothetical protein